MSTITVISTAQRRVVAARRRVRRWGKDCHAAVALEFVLIIPMLVGLLAFGNEAVGVRLQQKVLQDFSAVTADVIAGYYVHGPATGVTLKTDSSGTPTEDDTRSLGNAVTSGTHDNSGTTKLLSLEDLTGGMRVLLAEIHPVGVGTNIGAAPCSRASSLVLDSANPFTCQVIALAPANVAAKTDVNVTCDNLPAVWDKTALKCTDPTTTSTSTSTVPKITNPTSCGNTDAGDGYRITWRYGYGASTGAERVCRCADSLTVQGITVYDKKLLAVLNKGSTSGGGGFNLTTHDVPLKNTTTITLPRAGVVVWAASYRKGLFTGILNKETIERLTLQSWNWAARIEDPSTATHEAAGVALVDADGKNMVSCYGAAPAP